MASEEQHTNANKPDLGARFDRVLVNYLRSEKDMTFKKIGELAGLSESQISRAANGISELQNRVAKRFKKYSFLLNRYFIVIVIILWAGTIKILKNR